MASVSTNRGTSWTDNEVKALIGLWGESDVQEELDGVVRNKVVYEEIAKKMRQLGYNRDWGQCRNKIKSLKKRNTVQSRTTTREEKDMQIFFVNWTEFWVTGQLLSQPLCWIQGLGRVQPLPPTSLRRWT